MPRLLSSILCLCTGLLQAQVQVELVCDEPKAILDILAKRPAPPSQEDWARLFRSEGYIQWVRREAAFRHPIREGDIQRFVMDLGSQASGPEWTRTLAAWQAMDLGGCARRALAYLPEGASIRARVYPMIKPGSNSFVFEDHELFLWLDPGKSTVQVEHTLVHEFHHIGLSSLRPSPALAAELEALAPGPREAADWCGAFGEGFAMLAAAGAPDTHPHATSSAEARQRWDQDLARFDQDLRAVDQFLLQVAEGRLSGAAAQEQGAAFFGFQGPWYTVGWRMASTIERELGRGVLFECMRDPRLLLLRYNQATSMRGLPGARWSPELLKTLKVS